MTETETETGAGDTEGETGSSSGPCPKCEAGRTTDSISGRAIRGLGRNQEADPEPTEPARPLAPSVYRGPSCPTSLPTSPRAWGFAPGSNPQPSW